jgi:membrane protease YdiL (CAAX protease family)
MDSERTLPPWPLAYLGGLGAVSLACALALIHEEKMVKDGSVATWVRLTAACVPAMFAALWAFHPSVLTRLRAWTPQQVTWAAVGLVGWVFLLSADHFNPYSVAIVAAGAGAAVYALRDGVPPGRLGAAGLAVWLLLWIPFDLRWYRGSGGHMELFLSGKGGYALCSLLVTALGILSFGVVGRQRQGLGPPERLDWAKALVLLLVYGAIAIPVGLGTGFLSFEPNMGPGKAVLVALGLALTVALPEELFFRGILDTGLRRTIKAPWLSLAISSFAFGLMHWNNRDDPTEQLLYLGLATAAGVFYGLAHRWTGRLFAAVLIHTLVDLLWIGFFRG